LTKGDSVDGRKKADKEKGAKEKSEKEKASEMSYESSDEDLSEIEYDSDEERRQAILEDRRKKMRDLKMCKSKVWHINTKEKHAKEERIQLKNRIKVLNTNLKDEARKYKELEREVKKLGAMMKGSDDEGSDEEDEEESESESEESESESSESSTDDESSDESESDDEGLPLEDRVQRMQEHSKRKENTEKAIKKGNYMLKTTAERLFDKLRNEREKYRALERELNELVSEMD